MRQWLLAPLVALLAAGPAAAADPPVVFQTLPVGRVLNDARAVVGSLAGEKAVASVNDAIKDKLGEKGFAGLDLARPLGGYVHLPADPTKAVGVLVVPVTEEQAFLGFFERLTGSAPKAGADGLYTVPANDPGVTIGLRFAEGYAYFAAGGKGAGDPAAVLAKDKLVPVAKLTDPGEQSLLTVRVFFDRLPPELRGQVKGLLAQAKEAGGMLPLPGELAGPAGKATGEAIKLAERWLKLSEGAKEAAVRITLDPGALDLGAEFTVVPLPGSELGKLVAARKPTTNRFAGLLTPDAASGFVTRLPFFNDELRTAATDGLQSALNAVGALGGNPGDLASEVLKGLIRTVKTGEFDVAGSIRGPDKNGQFSMAFAMSFEDTKAVEKSLKTLIENDAPPEFQKAVKWNAAKEGDVAIHVIDFGKLPQEGRGGLFFGPEMKAFGGPDAKAAFAFTPKAVYQAVGPDAVGEVKKLLALKAAEAPVLTVTLNPTRVMKLASGSGASPREVDDIAKTFGSGNEPITLASLAVTGGGELKVSGHLSLRVLGAWFGVRTARTEFRQVEPEVRPAEKK